MNYNPDILIGILHILCNRRHWGKVVGDVFLEAWKLLFDIVHERRAARACKKALFGKLLRLR